MTHRHLSRRALLAATATAAFARVPARAGGLPPVAYGPVDGAIAFSPTAGAFAAHAVAVGRADVLLSATFTNPFPEPGDWYYGFGFRQTAAGGGLVYLQNDGSWHLQFYAIGSQGERVVPRDERGDYLVPPLGGSVAPLRTGADEANDAALLITGDVGELRVNGEDVAAFDLSALPSQPGAGDAEIGTNYWGGFPWDGTHPGATLRYERFAVGAPAPPPSPFAAAARGLRYGPAHGGLRHERRDGRSDTAPTGARLTEGAAVRARFRNPYGAETGAWNYGFTLGDYRLYVRSDGTYVFERYIVRTRGGPGDLPIQRTVESTGLVGGLRTGAGEANDLEARLDGGVIVLTANDGPVARLAPSFAQPSYLVSVVTGLDGASRPGATTRYEFLTIT